MPDPVNRSSASQIASYGPPAEPLSCEPQQAAAAPTASTQAPAHLDLGAGAPVLERPVPQTSYEKCIAKHEKVAQDRYGVYGAVGGCVTFGAAGAGVGFTLGKTLGASALGAGIGCIGGGFTGFVASASQGTTIGATEGKLACDDLPKKP